MLHGSPKDPPRKNPLIRVSYPSAGEDILTYLSINTKQHQTTLNPVVNRDLAMIFLHVFICLTIDHPNPGWAAFLHIYDLSEDIAASQVPRRPSEGFLARHIRVCSLRRFHEG